MPEADDAKTKSAPKRQFNFAKWALIIAALLLLLLPLAFSKPATATLTIGERTYHLDIASTPEAQKVGLGGRERLASDAGMVFVFDTAEPQCMWMEDMQFPIDILWLDEAKRVVHIERTVSPDSYPEKYCPPEPAKYVIELAAGQANTAGLKIGQKLSF